MATVNPKAGRVARRPHPLPLGRFRKVGASRAAVAWWSEQWPHLRPADRAGLLAEWDGMDDLEFAAAVEPAGEHRHPDADAAAGAVAGTVREVVAWVNAVPGKRRRERATLTAELERNGQGRTTLLAELDRLAHA